jgi:peptidylprolyl isomerase
MLAAAALLLVSLTACSSGQDTDCGKAAPTGRASNLIAAKGSVHGEPAATFPTPLRTSTTERTILDPGHGQPLQEGQAITANLSIYNGTTGQLLPRSAYGAPEGTLSLTIGQTAAGISQGLVCARPGAKVAIAVSPKDGVNDKKTSLVVVVDVRKAFLQRADGAPQPHQPGLPKVVLAPGGAPGITVPKTKAPTKLQIADLKKGDGATVKRGDHVVVQYTGVLWKDGTVFDSTWTGKGATTLVAADASAGGSGSSGGVIAGFADAMIGAKVGSQVLAVVPPSKGYGAQGSGSIPANATLVFVVDILGIR